MCFITKIKTKAVIFIYLIFQTTNTSIQRLYTCDRHISCWETRSQNWDWRYGILDL